MRDDTTVEWRESGARLTSLDELNDMFEGPNFAQIADIIDAYVDQL
jgi:hypothetical protein